MMKLKMQRLAALASVLVSVFAVSACATPWEVASAPEIAVERVSSQQFAFDWVQAQRCSGGIQIRGAVARQIPHRGAIPGYVRVAVIGPDGAVLADTDASLMRRNRQDRSARFHARLTTTPPAGSRLQVEHVTSAHTQKSGRSA